MIRLENITAGYGDAPVLKGLSFDWPTGQAVVVTGATGSGKTTLLRLIAGLDRPAAGRIFIDGVLVDDQTTFVPPHRRGIGMVFQQRALWPHMTVRQTLRFVLNGRSPDAADRRIETLLNELDLADLHDRLPQALSGGEATRLAVARCLADRRKLLLMDEPFNGLDATSRQTVVSVIRQQLEQTDTRLLLVTHRADEAHNLAARHVHLRDGRFEAEATP